MALTATQGRPVMQVGTFPVSINMLTFRIAGANFRVEIQSQQAHYFLQDSAKSAGATIYLYVY